MTTSRKQHWEQVYTDKSPLEVSWYQAEPRLSLELIEAAGVAKDAAIIDVGGGASLLVDRLWDDGFRNLAVLDIAAAALDAAKARLGADAQGIEWFVADVTEFQPPHAFALWHDRAVFHFLTRADDRRKYVEVLQKALPSGGRAIIAAFAIGGPEKCSGLDIVQYDAAKIAAELGEGFELLETRAEVHMTPANKEQKFGFFRFVKK